MEHAVTTMPTARQPGCPFDPPAELIDAREQSPISRLPFADGHQGWLITGFDLVRSVLADSRFSSRKELMGHHPTIDYGGFEVPPAPPGEFLFMDDPQHSRYRKPLVGVELGGQTIKAGTTVILSYATANRDPERFTEPHVLDLRRQDGGHLGFGHGIHQCLGQQLARVEMRVAFTALVNRFPTLRLAVPAEEVALRPETADIYGAKSLPVTWDA